METPKLLWATCASVWLPSQETSIFLCSDGISCLLVHCSCILPCQWPLLRVLSPLLPPIRCVYIVELPQPLEPSLLWVEQFQLSQPSLYWKMLHSCNQSSLWHCTGLTPVSSYLSCTGGLRTGPSTSDVASMSSSVHLVRPQPVLVHGVIPPPIFRILHFFILNFMKFLLDHFSILLRFLWMAAWPLQLILDCLDGRMMLETTFPHFILPANLLRVCSAPSSRPLMKMLNSVGHSIDCVDTPLWTHLQQDFVPLVQPFGPFIVLALCLPGFVWILLL